MHKYKVANVLPCETNEYFTIDCGNAFGKLSRAPHIQAFFIHASHALSHMKTMHITVL